MSRPARHRAANERAHAARLLLGVVSGGRTSDQMLSGASATPLTQELVLGTLRRYFSLERDVGGLLHRPLKAKDDDLRMLMLIGLYQLRHTRIPDHAALYETVQACAELGKPWGGKLVNALLRRAAAGRDSAAPASEHPRWLEQALGDAYPDAAALMAANNARAPMALRINLSRTSPAEYRARLDAAGIGWRDPGAGIGPDAFGPETLLLEQPQPASRLPGHADGLVSVQDAGAQLAAGLLAPEPGDRLLDACAAPGGKLFHLLERYPQSRLTALDRSSARLDRLRAEAARLGHERFDIVTADAAELGWWDGTPFQQVLLDAPCSGTGTLRRHPDIKVLRRRTDLAPLVELQRRLLDTLWQVLEPGGTLVYCTCSILPAENDDVIGNFLAARDDVLPRPPRFATGRATAHGWQLLPTDPDTDGFYYARLTRTGT